MPPLFGHLSEYTRSILGEFRTLPAPGPRMIDEAECVLSVLLAIVFANALHADNIGWAAFSGYMVMRSHVSESFVRGVLRIVGTVIGAGAALMLASYIATIPVAVSVALFLFGGFTLYFSIVGRRAYAWLFTGLTFSMVLIEAMQHPDAPVIAFAQTRILEVVAGTAASVLVSAISTYTVRRALPEPGRTPEADTANPGWYPEVARQSVLCGITMALVPWLWLWTGIESLSQSAITIFVVLMLPLANLQKGTLESVSSRIVHRVAGCTAGGVAASALLLLSHHSLPLMTLGLCAGVIVGRHIQNGPAAISYFGLQFTLAFLVVLVPDDYAVAAIGPGLDRLFGILLGVVMLEPILLAAYCIPVFRSSEPGSRPENKSAEE